MLQLKHLIAPAVCAFFLLSNAAAVQAQAPVRGKLFAKVGDWEVKRFPKYCVASIGFEGDRGLRIYSGADSFAFGFMGPGSATAPAKLSVTYWFDNNNKAGKQTRFAVKRANYSEDGGAPWLMFVDPAAEPSHAGDFELARTVTFTYRADGAAQSETFQLKGAKTAFAKVFECSGQ